MAVLNLIDVRLLTGGYEVTTDHNDGTLNLAKELKKATVFGQRSHVYKSGIKSAEYSLNGYFESDGTSAINDIHDSQYTGTATNVLTFVMPDGAVGAVTYSFESLDANLAPFGGNIGDMNAFTVSGSGSGDVFRGTLVEPGTTARSSPSNSSEYLLGDVVTGETLYAALHVIATTGSPTLDVTVESDTTGFPSATTHITFPQATAVGDGYLTSTTTTTDTYWRAEWTFGGTGSITFAVAIGIV